jgi:hypothetical protein
MGPNYKSCDGLPGWLSKPHGISGVIFQLIVSQGVEQDRLKKSQFIKTYFAQLFFFHE